MSNRHSKMALQYWTWVNEGREVEWQFRPRTGVWSGFSVDERPGFKDDADYEIRLVPRTIKVNGIDVPEPMRESPEIGAKCWMANPTYLGYEQAFIWKGSDGYTTAWLQRGLIHATQEAAEAHGRAMCAASEVAK